MENYIELKLDLITEDGETYVLVSSHMHIQEIVNRIIGKDSLAYRFRFSERQLFISLLQELQISYDDFKVKYYYYNNIRKLHISESDFGYVWISTVGLVANKSTKSNRAVNSCLNQYTVVSLLLEKAIEVVQEDDVYDIDSYNFGLLNHLSPSIYHNVVFYIEVFCKAYLSITGINPPYTHKLSLIYQNTVEVMNNKGHGDTLFQILVLAPFYKFVDHLEKIPGQFKEQFIKYDDNPTDDTVILFDFVGLNEMQNLLELCSDFISDYFYQGTDTHYLRSNVYQRMLDKADTEEKKKNIRDLYSHLIKKNDV